MPLPSHICGIVCPQPPSWSVMEANPGWHSRLTFRFCDLEQKSLSELMFPHLRTGNSNERIYFVGFLWELSDGSGPAVLTQAQQSECLFHKWQTLLSFERSWRLAGFFFCTWLTIKTHSLRLYYVQALCFIFLSWILPKGHRKGGEKNRHYGDSPHLRKLWEQPVLVNWWNMFFPN